VLYLSPYSAGQLMNKIPPTGITVQVGVVSYVDASAGKIYVKQTTPLAVPASIITGTVAIANGGTGTTTPSLVAGTNVTISGSWPNQTINSTSSAGAGNAYAWFMV
jgi:cystathionine beta-lyase family protein involved in aluminum resistance